MLVETIQMDQRIARIHYSDYLKRCRAHRLERKKKLSEKAAALGREFNQVRIAKTQMEKEDEALLKAYRELSKGHQLLNIQKVIPGAGVDDLGRPRLAVCSADAKRVILDIGWNHSTFMSEEHRHYHQYNGRRVNILNGWLHANLREPAQRRAAWGSPDLRAIVPSIPPNLRPDNLDGYYILWEAEWETVPVDPYLLKRISEDMFVIVAAWNLTEIERSVLLGRL